MALNKQWRLIFNKTADRQFQRLESPIQGRILHYFDKILQEPNPKAKALPMKGNKSSFHRYRIGQYRIVCYFEDKDMVIVAVKVGHRREVYE